MAACPTREVAIIKTGKVVVINESDFDPSVHKVVGQGTGTSVPVPTPKKKEARKMRGK